MADSPPLGRGPQPWGWFAAGLTLILVGVLLVAELTGWRSDEPATPPTTTTAAPPATDPGLTRLTRLTARDFSIDYPAGWSVDRVDVVPSGADYLDTTVTRVANDSHHLVRVDVLPDGDARAVADDAIASLEGRGDFDLLRDEPVRFQTRSDVYEAVYLEFELDHPVDGSRIRTIDIFFGDASGRVFAVLTRSPVADHASWASTFARVRASLSIR